MIKTFQLYTICHLPGVNSRNIACPAKTIIIVWKNRYFHQNCLVLLGASEAESAALAAETVTTGDPTFAGPLAGVQLGLKVYHAVEPEFKAEVDESVYDDQIGMMEMVLDVDDIVKEMSSIREQFSKF